MPRSFLDRWLGAPSLPSLHQEALREMADLAESHPVLSPVAAALTVVVRTLAAQERLSLPTAPSPPEGVPFLATVRLDWPSRLLRDRALALARTLPQAQEVVKSLTQGLLRFDELVSHLLAGRHSALETSATTQGLDSGLVKTLLRWTLFPLLVPVAEGRLFPDWKHGNCPVCGSWPLLGELRGLEQTRWLRCALCAADWAFPRLACPYCGTQDHRVLGHLHVEGEEARQRAATCDACHGYVKLIATLAPLSAPGLLTADLATFHLDLAATERGYAVPIQESPS